MPAALVTLSEACRCPIARGATAATDSYSVLTVSVWRRNLDSLKNRAGHRVLWVAERPASVRWRAQPGRTSLVDCFVACRDLAGTRLMLLGVNGCECGSTDTAGNVTVREWKMDSSQGKAAQGFLLVEKNEKSAGFRPRTFEWNHDVKEAKFENTTGKNVKQAWMPGPATNSSEHPESSQNVTYNGENTDSKETHRQRSLTVTGENITITSNKRTHYIMAKAFLTEPDKSLNRETAAQNSSSSAVTEFLGRSMYPATYRRIKKRQLVHTRVVAKQSGVQSRVARAVLDGGQERRRRVTEYFNGTILLIKPAVNGTCYVGPANKTYWKSANVSADNHLKCLCHCLDKEQLFVAILEGGSCFCGLNSDQMGNVTSGALPPAACPKGTERTTFSVTGSVQPLLQYCKHANSSESIRIGETGQHRRTRLVLFHSRGIRRMISSEDGLSAMHTSRSVLNRATSMHKKHAKNGTMIEGRWSHLYPTPFARLFRLELVERRVVNYDETYFFHKDESMEMRKYKRISMFL
ncbi:uncharacterized protein LOC119102565 [Pollicipes pollicipes]|uniref:uncharacterized protein LOC119102565 n=1 Tax=Pollicipes pollicipes TaxID=41117 RepID=UPI001884E149|nr:uncharacterized protein LOC119102565 [Pollicipes pollicipes]